MANNRIAYGLCKKYGIKLKDGATPADAWKALRDAGHGDEADAMSANSENDDKSINDIANEGKEKKQSISLATSRGEYNNGKGSSFNKNTEESLAKKQAIDLLQVSSSKYDDPDKVKLMKSEKGNWIIYYDGNNTGIMVQSSKINEEDAMKNDMIIDSPKQSSSNPKKLAEQMNNDTAEQIAKRFDSVFTDNKETGSFIKEENYTPEQLDELTEKVKSGKWGNNEFIQGEDTSREQRKADYKEAYKKLHGGKELSEEEVNNTIDEIDRTSKPGRIEEPVSDAVSSFSKQHSNFEDIKDVGKVGDRTIVEFKAPDGKMYHKVIDESGQDDMSLNYDMSHDVGTIRKTVEEQLSNKQADNPRKLSQQLNDFSSNDEIADEQYKQLIDDLDNTEDEGSRKSMIEDSNISWKEKHDIANQYGISIDDPNNTNPRELAKSMLSTPTYEEGQSFTNKNGAIITVTGIDAYGRVQFNIETNGTKYARQSTPDSFKNLIDSNGYTSDNNDTFNPRNKKYNNFHRSDMTNVKHIYSEDVYDRDSDKTIKQSLVKYIPYGTLEDGLTGTDDDYLYGLVKGYNGEDVWNKGAEVSVSENLGRDAMNKSKLYHNNGRDKHLGRGKYDKEYFDLLNDRKYFTDDERNNYSKEYGWDFSKPWEDQDIDNDFLDKMIARGDNGDLHEDVRAAVEKRKKYLDSQKTNSSNETYENGSFWNGNSPAQKDYEYLRENNIDIPGSEKYYRWFNDGDYPAGLGASREDYSNWKWCKSQARKYLLEAEQLKKINPSYAESKTKLFYEYNKQAKIFSDRIDDSIEQTMTDRIRKLANKYKK